MTDKTLDAIDALDHPASGIYFYTFDDRGFKHQHRLCSTHHLKGLAARLLEAEAKVAEWQTAFDGIGAECIWTYDDYECRYATSCGRDWYFTDGDRLENRADFCMGCGNKIVDAPNEGGSE